MSIVVPLLLLVGTALIIISLLLLIIPAVTRELFQNRLHELLWELENYVDEGAIPRHPYVRHMSEAVEFLAAHPSQATFAVALVPSRGVQQVEHEWKNFKTYASPAEIALLKELQQQFTRWTVRQMVLNSIAWAPMLMVIQSLRLRQWFWQVPAIARFRASTPTRDREIVAAFAC